MLTTLAQLVQDVGLLNGRALSHGRFADHIHRRAPVALVNLALGAVGTPRSGPYIVSTILRRHRRQVLLEPDLFAREPEPGHPQVLALGIERALAGVDDGVIEVAVAGADLLYGGGAGGLVHCVKPITPVRRCSMTITKPRSWVYL